MWKLCKTTLPHALISNINYEQAWKLDKVKDGNGIATESEAVALGGKTPSGYEANKCLIQSRVSACGCKTSSTGTDPNQCVQYKFLSKAAISLGTCKLVVSCSGTPAGAGYYVNVTINGSGYTPKSGVYIKLIRVTYIDYQNRNYPESFSNISLSKSSFSATKNSKPLISIDKPGLGKSATVDRISFTDGYEMNFNCMV